MRLITQLLGGATALAVGLAPTIAVASSHREAPYITKTPKVDGTDLYVFNSYESGRSDYVTILANYYPVQDPDGGPNFFMLDEDAIYEIHIDNNGDAKEDITFRFDFDNVLASKTGIQLDVGPAGQTKKVAVPFIAVAPVSAGDEAGRNVFESYTVDVISGAKHGGAKKAVEACKGGGTTFAKPLDNIGNKTIPNYDAYARSFIHEVNIPGCKAPAGSKARLFVGQRQEGFAVNVSQIFDLLNFDTGTRTDVANILGEQYQGFNDLTRKSVTTLALEVPAACLTTDAQSILGVWTTSSVRQARVINPKPTFDKPTREGGPWAQVSRLGNPLVNEVIIGLKDKDLFNSSEPADDGQFADYVTNPTLPEVVELLFGGAGVAAPNRFPRVDLVAAFLTGIAGVNANGSTAEMMRLNTAIPATAMAQQNPYGAALCFDAATATADAALNTANAGCDPAGFPNGRRPGDDVTDIELRVAMGYLLNTTDAPSGQLPIVDGAGVSSAAFDGTFPYLTTPRPGAPKDPKPGDLPVRPAVQQ